MMRGWTGLTIAAALAAAPAHAAAGAAARIEAYDAAVVAVMKAKLPMRARVERFTAIVGNYYDMPGIAALVIGPGWASTSAADRATLTAALQRHSAVSLAKNFKSYDGERFELDPATQARGGDTIVKVTIVGGGRDVLYFRTRGAGGQPRIVDVISGGVSQLAVQRADLAGTAASGGAAAVAKRLAELDVKAMGGS